MSVFLTPDLQPFFGGTYYPPRDAYGRPGEFCTATSCTRKEGLHPYSDADFS